MHQAHKLEAASGKFFGHGSTSLPCGWAEKRSTASECTFMTCRKSGPVSQVRSSLLFGLVERCLANRSDHPSCKCEHAASHLHRACCSMLCSRRCTNPRAIGEAPPLVRRNSAPTTGRLFGEDSRSRACLYVYSTMSMSCIINGLVLCHWLRSYLAQCNIAHSNTHSCCGRLIG